MITYFRHADDADLRAYYWDRRLFKSRNLVPITGKESDEEFALRARISPYPLTGIQAVQEIILSIGKSFHKINRVNLPESLEAAIKGYNRGINGRQATMRYFILNEVLPELLVMGRVCVFVDRVEIPSQTTINTPLPDPIAILVPVEYVMPQVSYDVFGKVSEVTFHLYETEHKFKIIDNQVTYNDNVLGIPMIPVIYIESESVIENALGHLRALLNLESTDIAYSIKSNFPFYTEQRPAIALPQQSSLPEGPQDGRTYPIGAERPAFINPSPEPLKISMEKQANLKADIRASINARLAQIGDRTTDSTLNNSDNAVSAIASILEVIETRIALIWSQYVGHKQTPSITYPKSFATSTPSKLLEDLALKQKIIAAHPDKEFQLEQQRLIAAELGSDTYEGNPQTPIIDPKTILLSVELGVLAAEHAADLLGYPAGTAKLAQEQTVERLQRIAAAQLPRGVREQADPTSTKEEQRQYPGRGEARYGD